MAILEVRGLSKRFGSLEALRGVTFDVEPGEIFGIAGPNGAGKSVLFNTVAGYYRPTSGEVLFDGQRTVGMSPHQVCHLGLARTFQTPTTFHSLTVADNVRVGALFGGRDGAPVREILQFLDLDAVADAPATNLDLYTMKKVVLGAALATRCTALLLDEPMAGFSLVEIEHFLELLRRINREWSITLMVIEHLLDVLIGTSDRMLILHYGEVLYQGSPDEVKRHPRVAEVYLGEGGEAGGDEDA